MATYASSTNPFIKVPTSSNVSSPEDTRRTDKEPAQNGSSTNGKVINSQSKGGRRKKKNAPGRARPQIRTDNESSEGDHKSDNLNQKDNLMLCLDEVLNLEVADNQEPAETPPVDVRTDQYEAATSDNNSTVEALEAIDTKLSIKNHSTLLESSAKEFPDDTVDLLGSTSNLTISGTTDETHETVGRQTPDIDDKAIDEISRPHGSAKSDLNSCVAINRHSLKVKFEVEEDYDEEASCEDAEKIKAEGGAIAEVDGRRRQHMELINKLRSQLRDLERYAYERGELDQAPASVLAERQTVILETLKKKLPLQLDSDKIERLELEELKCQVDKEISDLIDPLLSKDQLLNQLKSQLIDLEQYVSHLHRVMGVEYAKDPKSSGCSCTIHGCVSPKIGSSGMTFQSLADDHQNDNEDETFKSTTFSILSSDKLPKTSRLIRSLMAQLICSDIKIQEAMRMQKDYNVHSGQDTGPGGCNKQYNHGPNTSVVTKPPQFHDGAVWTMHLDRVLLATDSLTNLYATDSSIQSTPIVANNKLPVDESLVDSVVRRQLVPAIRDLLAYGLIDPNAAPRSTYRSFLFDPYYLISSLTCLPGSQTSSEPSASNTNSIEKIHVWNVIDDYFRSRNETEFAKSSSMKTLSQSFNLTPSLEGPLKVTSKQALLITVDDIIGRLSRCKPNGPDSHFKLFVYTALNQAKLATWIRIVFKNKNTLKKYYHNFSFVSQPEKMEKFLTVIDVLSQINFKLNTDTSVSVNQFVSAY